MQAIAPRYPSLVVDYRRLIAAGLFFAGDLAVWHWSIRLTSVANATLFANFAPVFVTLGAWLLFGQRLRLTFLLGTVIGLIGTTMLIGTSLHVSVEHLFGDLLGLLTAVFYAGYILAVKRLRGDFSAATILTWSGTVTCVTLLPITLLSGEGLIAFSTHGWVILIGLALFSHVGGHGLIAYALAHLPAPLSSVSLLLEPVVAAALAWVILDEAIGGWQALGVAIVLAGIVLARRGSP